MTTVAESLMLESARYDEIVHHPYTARLADELRRHLVGDDVGERDTGTGVEFWGGSDDGEGPIGSWRVHLDRE